jgi:hypothetical protein
MTRTLRAALAAACVLALAAPAAARIKDFANFESPPEPVDRLRPGGRPQQDRARSYDRNHAWAIKAAGAIQADIKPVADPKAKARAQATDFEAVSSG